nr:MBL fold metallo-hydrolase [Kibdelosporangium sp. MJ126-NF4]CEL23122.1 Beta-lactamase-like [Kibdelosporangium sp. MJ126-NF4]CTQ90259.1 Beta-lactamase-like [Kibdelosporangium sp. MJ126-NF4]
MPSSWTVGDITVHRVDEVILSSQAGSWLLPDATPEVVGRHDWLRPDFVDPDGALRLHCHSFALEKDGMRILVDTGVGNGKTRANPIWHNLRTGYLDNLAAAGFSPETIDLVLHTHLHADHVGWNTHNVDGQWVPTFRNARHITSRTEREFWAGHDMDEPRRQMFDDSVIPVEQAGLLDLVDVPPDGVEVAEGLRLLPTPGHTPGHLAIQVTSRGETAVITGDSVHHPVQIAHPDICACVDIDPRQSRATRRRLLSWLADTDALVLGTHFPPPTAVRVVPQGDGFRTSQA